MKLKDKLSAKIEIALAKRGFIRIGRKASDEEQIVARSIAEASLDILGTEIMSVDEAFNRANKVTAEYHINQIYVVDNDVYILLQRPGVFIGAKGQNIDKIQAKIEENLKRKIHIRLKETRVLDWLYLYLPEEDY